MIQGAKQFPSPAVSSAGGKLRFGDASREEAMRTHIIEAVRASLVRLASSLLAVAICGTALFACSERPLPAMAV